LHKLVSPSQLAFLKGRYIHDNNVSFHEAKEREWGAHGFEARYGKSL
jgi:hypothetical protein